MRYLILILCIIAALFVEYLFFAFCAWDMNPAAWHWFIRMIASFLAIFHAVIGFAIGLSVIDTYKIK
jgi:fumarate reductase subunit C